MIAMPTPREVLEIMDSFFSSLGVYISGYAIILRTAIENRVYLVIVSPDNVGLTQ